MKNTRSLTLAVALVLVFAVALAAGLAGSATAAPAGAPAAAITPVAANSALTGEASTLIKFYDGEALAADDLNRFDVYGVYTCVDVNLTNTNTLTITVYALARQ